MSEKIPESRKKFSEEIQALRKNLKNIPNAKQNSGNLENVFQNSEIKKMS